MQKNCGNCRFWRTANKCAAPLPDSIVAFIARLPRKTMFANSGAKCLAHMKRIERKPPVANDATQGAQYASEQHAPDPDDAITNYEDRRGV